MRKNPMTTTPRRSAMVLVALLSLLLALPALAKGGKSPNTNNGHGKITAVSDTSITVTPKTGAAKTYTIDAATKVELDGQAATAEDLAPGQHAKVKSADGVTARRIKAHTRKRRASKQDPIPPAPL